MKPFGLLCALACCAFLLITTTSSIAHQRPVVADQLRVSGVPVAHAQDDQAADRAVRLLPPMRQLLASADLLPGNAGRTASTDQPSATDIAAGMAAPTSVVTTAAEVQARSHMQQQAVRFVENRGQIADTDGRARPDILYTADAKGAQLYFRKDGVSYVFSKHEEKHTPSDDVGLAGTAGVGPRRPSDPYEREHASSTVTTYRMDMHLVGARTDVRVRAYGAVEGVDNYYLAHCPDGVLGVQSFTRIMYENVYAHIDLEYLTSGGRMKYNFIVHPGGNVADIRMRFSGASSMAVDEDGDLHIETPLGSIEEAAPVTYQHDDDSRAGRSAQPVSSSYHLHEHDLTFEVAPYDPTRTLIIDPWATYYGGSGWDYATGIATDESGNVVLTGGTQSTDFPTFNAVQSSYASGNMDAIVVKLDAGGARLWATYYGGSGGEGGEGIATDGSGNVVIIGGTGSSDFPVAGAVQTAFAGIVDAFVVKLDAGGARLWATYYGGSYQDEGRGIATDESGNVVITGETTSSDFPVVGAVQSSYAGDGDAFVVKLDAGGARLWATYYGGSDSEYASSIETDWSGNMVITGETWSSDFPVAGAWQRRHAGGFSDAFIVKLDAGGARLWATYYGGRGEDAARAIATDGSGNVVITGWTKSTDFPIAHAVQSSHAYSEWNDAFIVKLDAGGARLWATYYGGSDGDAALAIATDGSGNVVITGNTSSSDFPVAGAVQSALAGRNSDAFIVKLDAGGARLWATYYGGSDGEGSRGIATDGSGNVVITGSTESYFFPTHKPWQSSFGGGHQDAFIVHLTSIGTLTTAEAPPAPAGYELYPNPAAGDVLLGIPVQVQGLMHQIEVYDNLGRLVQREQVQAGQALHGLTTAMLAPGVYRIVLRANSTLVLTRLFIRR